MIVIIFLSKEGKCNTKYTVWAQFCLIIYYHREKKARETHQTINWGYSWVVEQWWACIFLNFFSCTFKFPVMNICYFQSQKKNKLCMISRVRTMEDLSFQRNKLKGHGVVVLQERNQTNEGTAGSGEAVSKRWGSWTCLKANGDEGWGTRSENAGREAEVIPTGTSLHLARHSEEQQRYSWLNVTPHSFHQYTVKEAPYSAWGQIRGYRGEQ